MGLFLAPLSGFAVGGGGHGRLDPPPPGVDPGSGPRAEVDTVNRSPLRLLRTTMYKHQPRFMKVVPPGQQPGVMAPPYTWVPRERDDWRYELPKRTPLRSKSISEDAKSATQEKRDPSNPSEERITALIQQRAKLRSDLQQLINRLHELTAAGRAHLNLPKTQASFESLARTPLRSIHEAQSSKPLGIELDPEEKRTERSLPQLSTSLGPAAKKGGTRWIVDLEKKRTKPLGLSRTPLRSLSRKRREERKQKIVSKLFAPQEAEPKKPKPSPPPQSEEIISLHKQIEEKRIELARLGNEIKQLRMQAKKSFESAGFNPNYRSTLLLQ